MDGRFFFIYGKERYKFYLPPLWCNKYQVRQNFIPREEVHSFDVVSCHPWCKMVFYLYTTVLAPSVTQLRIYSQMTPWWPTLFWIWLKILWLKLLWPRLKRICCSLNIPCDLGAARIDTKLKVINWLMIFWENIGLMYGIYIYCLLKRLS